MNESTCPICLNQDFEYLGGKCELEICQTSDNLHFDCSVCGQFTFPKQIYGSLTNSVKINPELFPRSQRALVSHIIKTQEHELLLHDLNWILTVQGRPTIYEQMNNIIVFLGNEFEKTGEELEFLPIDIHAIIGALNRKKTVELLIELQNRGLIKFFALNNGKRIEPKSISLTYEGAKLYGDLIHRVGQNVGEHKNVSESTLDLSRAVLNQQ